MPSDRIKLLNNISKRFDKVAQQLSLPGVVQPEIDLELLNQSDNDYLASIDLSDIDPFLHNDIRKIVTYALNENSDKPKDTIVNSIVSKAKEDVNHLILEYLDKIPELKANIPVDQQKTLPGAVPEIRLFPTKKDIELSKAKIQDDINEEEIQRKRNIEQYNADKTAIIEAYKLQHNGDEPEGSLLRMLMKYRPDPSGPSIESDRLIKPENISYDPEKISDGQYKAYLNKLYTIYAEIETRYKKLQDLNVSLDDIVDPAKLPEPDPSKFTTYEEMLYVLRDHVINGIKYSVKGSIGQKLFSASTNYSKPNTTTIFNTQHKEWFENPETMKQFLEEIPESYKYKDSFWNRYRVDADTLSYWFEQKYNTMVVYNKSLQAAMTSFVKGIKFYKIADKDIYKNVDNFLKTQAFKYSGYIVANPIFREKLNSLFLNIIYAINNSSDTLNRVSSYYNHGLYQPKYGDGVNNLYSEVDIGLMLSSKVPQKEMIQALSNLLTSSITSVSQHIIEYELGGIITSLSNDMAVSFLDEKLNLKQEDLDVQEKSSNELSESEASVKYGDPRAIKVADAWLKFASGSKLSANFQSLIKYPEFMFKNDKQNSSFLIGSIKERLGCKVAWILNTTLYHSFSSIIFKMTKEPTFVYNGIDDFKSQVYSKKHEHYLAIQILLNNFVSDGKFTFIVDDFNISSNISSTQRYNKLKIITDNIINTIDLKQSPLYQELNSTASKYDVTTYSMVPDTNNLSRILIINAITGKVDRHYNNFDKPVPVIYAFLITSMIDKLKKYIDRRIKDCGSLPVDYFVPNRIQEKSLSLDIKDLDSKENIALLNELKLRTDSFNNNELMQLKLLAGSAGQKEPTFLNRINTQLKLNNEFNENLIKIISEVNYINTIQYQMKLERQFSLLASTRLKTFGGIGPNIIDEKFKELLKIDIYKHLPLQEMAKSVANIGVDDLKENKNKFIKEHVSNMYNSFKGNSNAAVALAIISKNLNISNAHQLLTLYSQFLKELITYNINKEDIEYFFSALVTNINSIQSQVIAACKLAEFYHNSGLGVSKETILSLSKNANFKDWLNEVDAIEHFFKIYINIKRLGGPRKFMADNRIVIESMIKAKIIRSGLMRRMQLITSAFDNGTRINPSIEGFNSIRSLINQIKYDLDAITSYATFSKYNEQIKESKLFKDPQLAKLNWDVQDKKFRFRVLKTFDPYHFQVGVDTGCCQKLGGVGEAAAIDSYINPLAGVVLLEAMIDGVYKTISQSYFHYVPTDNGIILDNVETSDDSRYLKDITSYEIDEIYALWAKIKKEERGYKYFLCGTNYNKLDNEKYKHGTLKNDPRSFQYEKKYVDWKPRESIDLLKPKFELSTDIITKKEKIRKRTAMLTDLFEPIQFYKMSEAYIY